MLLLDFTFKNYLVTFLFNNCDDCSFHMFHVTRFHMRKYYYVFISINVTGFSCANVTVLYV